MLSNPDARVGHKLGRESSFLLWPKAGHALWSKYIGDTPWACGLAIVSRFKEKAIAGQRG